MPRTVKRTPSLTALNQFFCGQQYSNSETSSFIFYAKVQPAQDSCYSGTSVLHAVSSYCHKSGSLSSGRCSGDHHLACSCQGPLPRVFPYLATASPAGHAPLVRQISHSLTSHSVQAGDNLPLYGICCYMDEAVQQPPWLLNTGPRAPLPLTPTIPVAPRCYCLLTHYPFFTLHFKACGSGSYAACHLAAAQLPCSNSRKLQNLCPRYLASQRLGIPCAMVKFHSHAEDPSTAPLGYAVLCQLMQPVLWRRCCT